MLYEGVGVVRSSGKQDGERSLVATLAEYRLVLLFDIVGVGLLCLEGLLQSFSSLRSSHAEAAEVFFYLP